MINTKVEVSVSVEEVNTVSEYIEKYETEAEPVKEVTNVSKYLTSLASSQYKKSVEDIENTNFGDKLTRRRNLQQIMQESFFYGANRFGNNFIA